MIRGDRNAKEIRGEIQGVDRRIDESTAETNRRFDEVNKRFDDIHRRFDETIREIAEQRERMAKLEGSLEGFLAGRRDRNAA